MVSSPFAEWVDAAPVQARRLLAVNLKTRAAAVALHPTRR
jgi:hypothetical protein